MGMISSLLVFQYGQTRIWFAMSRDGLLPKLFSSICRFDTPHWSTWIAAQRWGSRRSGGYRRSGRSIQYRYPLRFSCWFHWASFFTRSQPERTRGFKVPFVPLFPIISVVLCVSLMAGLLVITWIRFFGWMAIGLVIYYFYSRKHSEFAGLNAETAVTTRG